MPGKSYVVVKPPKKKTKRKDIMRNEALQEPNHPSPTVSKNEMTSTTESCISEPSSSVCCGQSTSVHHGDSNVIKDVTFERSSKDASGRNSSVNGKRIKKKDLLARIDEQVKQSLDRIKKNSSTIKQYVQAREIEEKKYKHRTTEILNHLDNKLKRLEGVDGVDANALEPAKKMAILSPDIGSVFTHRSIGPDIASINLYPRLCINCRVLIETSTNSGTPFQVEVIRNDHSASIGIRSDPIVTKRDCADAVRDAAVIFRSETRLVRQHEFKTMRATGDAKSRRIATTKPTEEIPCRMQVHSMRNDGIQNKGIPRAAGMFNGLQLLGNKLDFTDCLILQAGLTGSVLDVHNEKSFSVVITPSQRRRTALCSSKEGPRLQGLRFHSQRLELNKQEFLCANCFLKYWFWGFNEQSLVKRNGSRRCGLGSICDLRSSSKESNGNEDEILNAEEIPTTFIGVVLINWNKQIGEVDSQPFMTTEGNDPMRRERGHAGDGDSSNGSSAIEQRIQADIQLLKSKDNDDYNEVAELLKRDLQVTERELERKQDEVNSAKALADESRREDEERKRKLKELGEGEADLVKRLWKVTEELLDSRATEEAMKRRRIAELESAREAIVEEIKEPIAAVMSDDDDRAASSIHVDTTDVMSTIDKRRQLMEQLVSMRLLGDEVKGRSSRGNLDPMQKQLNELKRLTIGLRKSKWMLASEGMSKDDGQKLFKKSKQEYQDALRMLSIKHPTFKSLHEEKIEEQVGEYFATDFPPDVILQQIQAEVARLDEHRKQVINEEAMQNGLPDEETKERKEEMEAKYKAAINEITKKKELLLKETVKLCRNEFGLFYKRLQDTLHAYLDGLEKSSPNGSDEIKPDPLYSLLSQTNERLEQNSTFLNEVNLFLENGTLPSSREHPMFALFVQHQEIEKGIVAKTDPSKPWSTINREQKDELDSLKNKQIEIEENVADQVTALKEITKNLESEREDLMAEVRSSGSINVTVPSLIQRTEEGNSNRLATNEASRIRGLIAQLDMTVVAETIPLSNSLTELVHEYESIAAELKALMTKSGGAGQFFPFQQVDELKQNEAELIERIEARVAFVAKFRFAPIDISELGQEYISNLLRIRRDVNAAWHQLTPKKLTWWSDITKPVKSTTHKTIKELQKEVRSLSETVDQIEALFSESAKLKMLVALQLAVEAKITRAKNKRGKLSKLLDAQASLEMNLKSLPSETSPKERKKSILDQMVSLDFLFGSKSNMREKKQELIFDIQNELSPIKLFFVPDALSMLSLGTAAEVSFALQDLEEEVQLQQLHIHPDEGFWDRSNSRAHLATRMGTLLEAIADLEGRMIENAEQRNETEDERRDLSEEQLDDLEKEKTALDAILSQYLPYINQELSDLKSHSDPATNNEEIDGEETGNEVEREVQELSKRDAARAKFQQLGKERRDLLKNLSQRQIELQTMKDPIDDVVDGQRTGLDDVIAQQNLEDDVKYLSDKIVALKDELERTEAKKNTEPIKSVSAKRVEDILGRDLFAALFAPEGGEVDSTNTEAELKEPGAKLVASGECSVQDVLRTEHAGKMEHAQKLDELETERQKLMQEIDEMTAKGFQNESNLTTERQQHESTKNELGTTGDENKKLRNLLAEANGEIKTMQVQLEESGPEVVKKQEEILQSKISKEAEKNEELERLQKLINEGNDGRALMEEKFNGELREKESLVNALSKEHNEQLNEALSSIRKTLEEDENALQKELEEERRKNSEELAEKDNYQREYEKAAKLKSEQQQNSIEELLTELDKQRTTDAEQKRRLVTNDEDLVAKQRQIDEQGLRLDGVMAENEMLVKENEELKEQLTRAKFKLHELAEKVAASEQVQLNDAEERQALKTEIEKLLGQISSDGDERKQLQGELEERLKEAKTLDEAKDRLERVSQERDHLADDALQHQNEIRDLKGELKMVHAQLTAVEGDCRGEFDALLENRDQEFKRKLADLSRERQEDRQRLTRAFNEERLKWDFEIDNVRKECMADGQRKLAEQKADLEKEMHASLYELLHSNNEEMEELQDKIEMSDREKELLLNNFAEEKRALLRDSEAERLALEATIQDLLRNLVSHKDERMLMKRTHKDELQRLEQRFDHDKERRETRRQLELHSVRERINRDYTASLQMEKDVMENALSDLVREKHRQIATRYDLDDRSKTTDAKDTTPDSRDTPKDGVKPSIERDKSTSKLTE